MSDFKLEPAEIQSPTWKKLNEHYARRQLTLRAQLEGNLDQEKTWRLRGRLAEIKALLALETGQAVTGDE